MAKKKQKLCFWLGDDLMCLRTLEPTAQEKCHCLSHMARCKYFIDYLDFNGLKETDYE